MSEIDKEKQGFASTQFHAHGFDVPPDFLGEPADRFDLIFVGSLFTHLNEDLSINALRYLTTALSEGGLLIFTTHGRYATMVARNAGHTQLHPETSNAFLSDGFGYQGGPTYGASFMAPSWVLRILEAMPDVHVLGYKERGWARHQDVFIVQRVTGWTDPRPAKDNRTGS